MMYHFVVSFVFEYEVQHQSTVAPHLKCEVCTREYGSSQTQQFHNSVPWLVSLFVIHSLVICQSPIHKCDLLPSPIECQKTMIMVSGQTVNLSIITIIQFLFIPSPHIGIFHIPQDVNYTKQKCVAIFLLHRMIMDNFRGTANVAITSCPCRQ